MDDFKNFKVLLTVIQFDNLSSSPDSLIDSQPFFLNNDGNILMYYISLIRVKDNSNKPRDYSLEDLNQFCRSRTNLNKSNNIENSFK